LEGQREEAEQAAAGAQAALGAKQTDLTQQAEVAEAVEAEHLEQVESLSAQLEALRQSQEKAKGSYERHRMGRATALVAHIQQLQMS
jgi:hypothetical protein